MSLHQLANHMSAQGRGPDSALVHMSPREVAGLQSLAMAHGGSLTVNPQTGLPEAGFLDRLLPTLLGGAATFFSGGAITPLMAAAGVGGLTALTSKDLGKGLMAGLGAYGGGSITEGLMGFGESAIGAEAAKAAMPSDVFPLGGEGAGIAETASQTARAGATNFDRLSRGVTEGFKNPMGAVSAIGGGSKLMGAGMLAAPLMSALSGKEATSVPTFGQTQFDPRAANVNMGRKLRDYQDDTGSSGQRGYFTPMNIDRNAAEGGFVSDGGIERFAGGGIPLDPNYDYSGYGRKPQARVAPVVQPKALPKPDFVGADGKTYRYDPMKKSWYVFKDVPEKTNPGVETLMGSAGAPGNDVVGDRPEGSYNMGYGVNPYAGSPQAFANGPLGYLAGSIANAFSTPKTAAEIEATPVEVRTGVPTQAGIDYGKTGFGKTGDPDQDIGVTPAAPDAPNTGSTGTNTNTGATGMGTGTTGGSPAQAGDIGNPGGPAAPAGPDPNAGEGGVGGINGPGGIGGGPAAGPAAGPEGPGADVGVGVGVGADAGIGGVGGVDPFAAGGLTAFASGGLGSLGGYSDGGRLLRGPGDGVSDSIPATVGNRQPARLADGEFVVPARIVSELGNGSTEAGARALYKMMDRIQANRRKTTGKNSVAVNSKSHKYLPA